MPSAHTRSTAAALAVGLVGALAACSAPAAPGSAASSSGGDAGRTIVLADSRSVGGYNPVAGYGQFGASLLYDGLLAMKSNGDGAPPVLEPALAASAPTPSADSRTWTVKLRDGITFSDGTPFDSADVVATYRAVLDPASASEIASTFSMIDKVDAPDAHTVTFTLTFPYAEFPSRLLLSIAPSEKLTGGPAEKSPLNAAPVGTGAYTLTELTSDRAVFTAKPSYFRGTPGAKTIRMVQIKDDNVRAQRMAAGELDGTVLPPTLAASMKNKEGLTIVPVRSVDFRTISLPSTVAFTKDTAARRAMNLAVDRTAIVDTILAGHGSPASTPIAPQVGAAYDKTSTFPHDPAAAEKLLDEAGWVKGPDGIRAKGGEKAAFPLVYAAADTVRRDLATAFAADMKKIGVDAQLEGSTWEKIEPRLGRIGLVLGGGKFPTSPDSLVYNPMHHRSATSSPYDNPGNFGSPALDKALDDARRTLDEGTRAQLYRDAQAAYLKDPGSVFLTFLHHTYVAKTSALPPEGTPLVLEPHLHETGWGPWWNVSTWGK